MLIFAVELGKLVHLAIYQLLYALVDACPLLYMLLCVESRMRANERFPLISAVCIQVTTLVANEQPHVCVSIHRGSGSGSVRYARVVTVVSTGGCQACSMRHTLTLWTPKGRLY